MYSHKWNTPRSTCNYNLSQMHHKRKHKRSHTHAHNLGKWKHRRSRLLTDASKHTPTFKQFHYSQQVEMSEALTIVGAESSSPRMTAKFTHITQTYKKTKRICDHR